MPSVVGPAVFVLGIVFPIELSSRQHTSEDAVLEGVKEAVFPRIELLVADGVVEHCLVLILMEEGESGGGGVDAVAARDATIRVGLLGRQPFPTGLLAFGLCERLILGSPTMIAQDWLGLPFCIHFDMNYGLEDIAPDGDRHTALRERHFSRFEMERLREPSFFPVGEWAQFETPQFQHRVVLVESA